MTQQQINELYKDLGNVCEKYGLKGIAGLWISPDEKDNTFAVFDPSDSSNGTLLKHIVIQLNKMLRDLGWKKPVHTKGLTDPDRDAN